MDNSSWYHILSFMDAYSDDNKIPLWREDQDKIAFIAEDAIYCCNVMPFRLKNVKAIY